MDRYLGIDPGVNGGMAVIQGVSLDSCVSLSSLTDLDTYRWIVSSAPDSVMIEQQLPRPTSFFDRKARIWRSSILRSTCILYGSYCRLLAFLIASETPYKEVTPQDWQKTFSLPLRKKGGRGEGGVMVKKESDAQWKSRLREKAKQLFPGTKITRATADAVLIAEHCRRVSCGGDQS